MTYHINSIGRAVRSSDGAQLAVEWRDGNAVFLEDESDHARAFAAWLADGNVPTPYAPTKDEQNAPVVRELEANERKAIRALIEGDAARIAEWKAKQDALRARLVK